MSIFFYLLHTAPETLSPRTGAVVTPHWCRCHPALVPLSPRTGAVITLHQCHCHHGPLLTPTRTSAFVTLHRCCCHPAPVPSSTHAGVVVTSYLCRCHPARVPSSLGPVTSRNSTVNLKKVEGGCYTQQVCYICARQIFRRQKYIIIFSLPI